VGDLMKTINQHGKRVVIAILASELITAPGILLGVMAISIGYVTLVNSLQAIQADTPTLPCFLLPLERFDGILIHISACLL